MIFQTVATSNRIAVMVRSMTTPSSTSFSFWQHLCVSSFTEALLALADVPGVLGGSRKPSGSTHKPHLALPARWEWSWGGGGGEWDANQLGINRGVTEQEGRRKKKKKKVACLIIWAGGSWPGTLKSEFFVLFCFNVKSTPSLSL